MIFEIYQGEDKLVQVDSNIDLTTATEIEVTIETPKKIVKSLTGGHITAVTANSYLLQIDAADTETIKPDPYKIQSRATIGGKKINGEFRPDKVIVQDSVFVDGYYEYGNDYGNR